MAISFQNDLTPKNPIKFESVEFKSEESIFILKSNNGTHEIAIEYKPSIEREFESKSFSIFFLSNVYLNAENDVFEIFEKKLGYRIGWLFPIQILESNENDYSDNEYLNKYKFPTTLKLLTAKNQTKSPSFKSDGLYNITDFYHDNICIFALCDDALPDGFEFNILDYLPSLANYGYYKWKPIEYHNFKEKERLILKYRGKKKFKVNSSNFKISESEFLTSLYKQHLISIDHYLLKFIFLYQVIEYLMDENFNTDFSKLVKEYDEKEITKNDLREQINDIARERGNISSLLSKTNINSELETDFKREATDFLSVYKKKFKPDLGNLIYDIRNLVTHNYREIIKSDDNVRRLNSITQLLELIINDMLITYNSDEETLEVN